MKRILFAAALAIAMFAGVLTFAQSGANKPISVPGANGTWMVRLHPDHQPDVSVRDRGIFLGHATACQPDAIPLRGGCERCGRDVRHGDAAGRRRQLLLECGRAIVEFGGVKLHHPARERALRMPAFSQGADGFGKLRERDYACALLPICGMVSFPPAV